MFQTYLTILCISFYFIQQASSDEDFVNLTLTKEDENLINLTLTNEEAEEVLSVLENKLKANETGDDYQNKISVQGMMLCVNMYQIRLKIISRN